MTPGRDPRPIIEKFEALLPRLGELSDDVLRQVPGICDPYIEDSAKAGDELVNSQSTRLKAAAIEEIQRRMREQRNPPPQREGDER